MQVKIHSYIKGYVDGKKSSVVGQDSENVAVFRISAAEVGNIFQKSRCSLTVILKPRRLLAAVCGVSHRDVTHMNCQRCPLTHVEICQGYFLSMDFPVGLQNVTGIRRQHSASGIVRQLQWKYYTLDPRQDEW